MTLNVVVGDRWDGLSIYETADLRFSQTNSLYGVQRMVHNRENTQ